MREDFLHYLWKHKKFQTGILQTVSNESVEVLSTGFYNYDAGPDFFNAKVRIAGQLWAGNVEIHLKSSDWFAHHHETDPRYDNVVLHVVWEHDAEVFRSNSSAIATLELRQFVDDGILHNCQQLFRDKQKWIPCEKDIGSIDDFTLQNWLERIYIERLELRSEAIRAMLKVSNNDWEATLFKLLAKNFGLKVNGEAFLCMANSLDFSVVRKVRPELLQLEALFFGQAGLLEAASEEGYFIGLKKEYAFLQKKFNVTTALVTPKFGRLRPPNFPTIRLAQLAALYHRSSCLFSELMAAKEASDFDHLLDARASSYWDTHYTFGNVSRKCTKRLSDDFVNLLVINSIVPLKFCYAQSQGKDINEQLLALMTQLAKEKNSILRKFQEIGMTVGHALHSQALLQLKNHYCNYKKCLQCDIGNHILNRN